MSKKKSKPLYEDKCPYWDLGESEECGFAQDGMYIPMPEHIRLFCLSTKYYKCRQYIRGCELMKIQAEYEFSDYLDSRDRRRLQRHPEHLYLDLLVCDRNVVPHLINSCKAKSLDVSLGGLRIESFKQLATDSVVSFVIDPEFSSDALEGVGEVKWCIPKEDSKKFESGIAFSNYSTSESLRKYLEV